MSPKAAVGTKSAVYGDAMPGDLRDLSPELRAAVLRARRVLAQEREAHAAAIDAGQIPSAPAATPLPPLSPEAREALREWRASGDYDRAVAEIVADDPDLRSE